MWSNFPMSDSPDLLVERDGRIVTLVMNRPEAKNSFSAEMLVRMVDAWEEIDADPEVRVAILTGAGDTFCAGADLKTMFGGQNERRMVGAIRSPTPTWRGKHYSVITA